MKNPWEGIKKPNRDVNVIRVSSTHPLSMLWGKDLQGRYLFIYEIHQDCKVDSNNLPKLGGINVSIVHTSGISRLVLLLSDLSNWELFYSLCLDLIKATSQLPEGIVPFTVILRRLTRWQAFLRKKRLDLLTSEEIKGLIGEMLFLSERVSQVYGWQQAMLFWKGPEGVPQDFSIHDTVIEVKCQTGDSKPSIKITSPEQLDPQVQKGFLAVYTIVTADPQDPQSYSLNDIVSTIQSKLLDESPETRDRFDDLLSLAGYIPREEYNSPKYKKLNLVCFELRDGFPRLLTSEIASGIENVTYHLKLDACKPFIKNPEWWEDYHE